MTELTREVAIQLYPKQITRKYAISSSVCQQHIASQSQFVSFASENGFPDAHFYAEMIKTDLKFEKRALEINKNHLTLQKNYINVPKKHFIPDLFYLSLLVFVHYLISSSKFWQYVQ